MTNKFSIALASIIFLLTGLYTNAQVSILHTAVQSFHVTPNSLCQISLLNSAGEASIRLEAQITNSANEVLVKVLTHPIAIKSGMNNIIPNQIRFSSVSYSNSNQAAYLKSHNKLSSGIFTYCLIVHPVTNLESGDEYCEDLEAVDDEFLYLVFPPDEEVIETTTPLLLWAHSEPFNLLSKGDYFRIVVVALRENQSADGGVIANIPIFKRDHLFKHQVPYPFDAPKLERGKRYGWQVQKISNNTMINSTEAWEFTIKKEPRPKDNMFVTLKRKLDASYYLASNDRIYFRFDEKYAGSKVSCQIYNDQRELLPAQVENIKKRSIDAKSTGYNQFLLDIQPYGLKQGIYVLEVINEKKEKFKLKFYVE